MTGLLTIVGAAIAATVVSFLLGLAMKSVTTNNWVHAFKTFALTGAVGVYVAGWGTWGAIVIMLGPLWLGAILGLIGMVLYGPLARRGYLGRLRKWQTQIEDPDDEYVAAMAMLGEQDVKEVADVSVDAEDFQQNIVKAAGLDGHEVPGLD